MADVMLNWFGERLGYTPSLHIESCSDGARMNSGRFGPFSHSLGFSIKREKPARAPISRLICSCSPPAIGRLIISIVVDAFNAVLWRRTWTHVLEKVFKTSPSLADLNAATAVVFIAWISWTSTTCIKLPPDSMFCGSGQSVRNRVLSSDAPTANAVSIPEPLSSIYNGFSAVASANPFRTPFRGSFRMQPQNSKGAKSFTRYVLKGIIHGLKDIDTLPATSTFNSGGIYG